MSEGYITAKIYLCVLHIHVIIVNIMKRNIKLTNKIRFKYLLDVDFIYTNIIFWFRINVYWHQSDIGSVIPLLLVLFLVFWCKMYYYKEYFVSIPNIKNNVLWSVNSYYVINTI